MVKDGAIGIHNGIIVNDENCGNRFQKSKRNMTLTPRSFLVFLQMHRAQGKSLVEAVQLVFGQIEGSASVALQFDDVNSLVLASNTGSLYMALSQTRRKFLFLLQKNIYFNKLSIINS